jgi:hypothetical protein
MSINPEGIEDSINTLDNKEQSYVSKYKPLLQRLYDGLINGDNDYSNGIGVVHPLKSDAIEVKEKEADSYQKCSALRFINKNQRFQLERTGDFSFIRHINISDKSDTNDAYTKREISKLTKNGIRCTSYAVDNSWILD